MVVLVVVAVAVVRTLVCALNFSQVFSEHFQFARLQSSTPGRRVQILDVVTFTLRLPKEGLFWTLQYAALLTDYCFAISVTSRS